MSASCFTRVLLAQSGHGGAADLMTEKTGCGAKCSAPWRFRRQHGGTIGGRFCLALQEVDMKDHEIPATKQPVSGKKASGSDKAKQPSRRGGDQARKAQEWGGGSKASKGPITPDDKHNPNSSQRS
jgi:hypothetical protein